MRHNRSLRSRLLGRGFTLLELLVVIGVIAILLALLLPAVRYAREPARRMQCSNNLKQLGLALHNYHDSHGHFPAAMGGTGIGATPMSGNANRLSGLVALLPFIEQQPLWEKISTPTEADGIAYPAMGPAPWIAEYPPWQQELPTLRCASAEAERADFGRKNYAFSIGDVAQQIHQPEVLRGAFACRMVSRIEDITDGLSTTIAMTEIGTPQGLVVAGQFATHQPSSILSNPRLCRETLDSSRPRFYARDARLSKVGRGGRWSDGAAGYGLVNTVLPPNSPSCAIDGSEAVDGIYSAGGFHPYGLNILVVDGSVRFVSNDIDAGDATRPPPSPQRLAEGTVASPYGVWGALGTAASEDDAEADNF